MVNMGSPSETSVSTVTFLLEMPSMKAEAAVLYIDRFSCEDGGTSHNKITPGAKWSSLLTQAS
jgi:hypothetical protein